MHWPGRSNQDDIHRAVCVPVEFEYALDAWGGLLSRFGQRPAGSAVGVITIHSQCTLLHDAHDAFLLSCIAIKLKSDLLEIAFIAINPCVRASNLCLNSPFIQPKHVLQYLMSSTLLTIHRWLQSLLGFLFNKSSYTTGPLDQLSFRDESVRAT